MNPMNPGPSAGQALSGYFLQALPAVALILSAVIAWLGKKAGAWLTAHTKLMDNELFVGIATRLGIAATNAVQAVEQTTVTSLKASSGGKTLSPGDVLVARNAAIDLMKKSLGGAAGVAKVQDILQVPDIEAELASLVEATVRRLKAPVVVAPAVPLGPAVASPR